VTLCVGPNIEGQATALMMPAPQQQQWQLRQGNICNDASIAMATMPKRRWQWRQCNDHDDASSTTATMATAPAPRPQ
jgi:hypothetical protein